MNIFYLHFDPRICAQMHVDKHVIKMILEVTQLLCSAWHMTDPEHFLYTPCYKLTHKNHPSSVWTRKSKSNFAWLCDLGLELCTEYTYRYGKVHKCEQYIINLQQNVPPLPDAPFTPPTLAMPDQYKHKGEAIESYRTYYFFEKINLHSWKGKIAGRDPPSWIQDMHNIFQK